MNRLTVFFIIIWGAAFVMLSINSLVLTCKWAPMKKGKVPKKFTWHHHQNNGVMQLVDFKIHSEVSHIGGFSIWGKK